MGAKKSAPKPVVDEIVDDVEIVDVIDDLPTGDIDSASPITRDRIMTLLRRRGPVGSFEHTMQVVFDGAKMPSDEDGWVAFANSLER